MKKYITVILMIFALITLISCGDKKEENNSFVSSSPQMTMQSQLPETAAPDTTPKLQIVIQGEISPERAEYINEVLQEKGFGYHTQWICESDLAPSDYMETLKDLKKEKKVFWRI